MSRQERQLDAAEYVIGTMTSAERMAFEVSIEGDAETREDVAFWESAFGVLNSTVPPEIPSQGVWEAISKQIDEAVSASPAPGRAETPSTHAPRAANDNLVASLERSRSRWRFGAVAAAIAAFVLGVLVARQGPGSAPTDQLASGDEGRQYIAVVNAGGGDQPSLIVDINAATGNVTVRSLGIERPADKSLELWYVPQGQRPVSVGLVAEGDIDLSDVNVADGDLLAISLEPPGGSPTGTATGPVVYTGKLVENVNAD